MSNTKFYFLSPIEVMKVTSQNMEEVAAWCGGSVQETESRRNPGKMDSYVLVPTPANTKISWAFPGMFVTKRMVISMKNDLVTTFAVFRREYFDKNYFDSPKEAADKTWERAAAEKAKPAKKQREINVDLTSNVGQALLEAQQRVKELEELAEGAGLIEKSEMVSVEEIEEKLTQIETQLTPLEEKALQDHADRLMNMKSDAELDQLVKDGHIRANDLRRHRGEPQIFPEKVPNPEMEAVPVAPETPDAPE